MSALSIVKAVPGWAWAALGGAIVLGVGVWWHQQHAAAVVDAAVQAERKVWTDAQTIAQIQQDTRVAITEMVADVNMEAERRESQARQRALEASNARLSARAVSLQRTAEDFRAAIDRAASDSPSCGPIADAARTAGEVFERCGSAHIELAKEAGRLAAKVTGLQGYITRVVGPVCVAGLAQGQDRARIGDQPLVEAEGAAAR